MYQYFSMYLQSMRQTSNLIFFPSKWEIAVLTKQSWLKTRDEIKFLNNIYLNVAIRSQVLSGPFLQQGRLNPSGLLDSMFFSMDLW